MIDYPLFNNPSFLWEKSELHLFGKDSETQTPLLYKGGGFQLCKVLVDLKLQLCPLIQVFYKELKKILVSGKLFKVDNYFCSTGTVTTNKVDGGIPVTHLQDFRY